MSKTCAGCAEWAQGMGLLFAGGIRPHSASWVMLMGLECGNKTVERKKTKGGLNRFPLTLRKEDNCMMMDHSWCTPVLFPLQGALVKPGAEHCQLLICSTGSPWEAVSWHFTCCSWAVSPLVQDSLAALVQWLLHYHGNCSKALNCRTLTGKLFAFWVHLSLLSCLLSFFLWS